ncbi:choice-of-anchor U domain-containing protein, partial [Candidatus Parabeggiatoa sp. HSG14]|uniref:choice-of-anchor U domain-containing protein n=1 Tax=Candidatus Parabeggiatoa sp. HSG14 TaxID=3055593 RepID=UPI0025A89A12|nr:choice-of-anchor U domain-containing protein [Thiotrichales bacterium HSG14]
MLKTNHILLFIGLLLSSTCVLASNPIVYDGNGDGILDSQQANVITIPDAITGKYITLAVNSDCRIDSTRAETSNTQAISHKGYRFPQGLMYYKLYCQQAHITLYFHGIHQAKHFTKYGPKIPGDLKTVAWYTLPNVSFGTANINGQSVATAQFTLKDGELGDDTSVDGYIVDPGGLSFNDDVGNVVSFISKSYSASRKAGLATITIHRNGLVGSFSVDYSTIGNTAITGQDFQPVSGSLSWVEGERGDKTFTIPLSENATIGSSLQLNLSNLTIAEDAVLGIDTALLTITDEEVPPELLPLQPVTFESPILSSLPKSPIDIVYNGHKQVIPYDVVITITGSVSHLIFEGRVENYGLVSNSTIKKTLTGGKLTGYIINEGTIADTELVGASITGGTLAGTITNNSEVGGIIENVQLATGAIVSGGKVGGIIKGTSDSTLKNIELVADTVLIGGKLSGEITSDPEHPTQIGAVEIAPDTVLSNVRLSPTVQLPEDVVLGNGVIQPADIDNPTMEDFGLDSEKIAELDAKQIEKLEPVVFNTFDAEEVEQIPMEAVGAMGAEQMAQFTPEALDGLSVEQFEQLPLESLGGLTSTNMGGLPTDILSQFTPEHLAALNPASFKLQPTQNMSKIFNNLDIEKVKNTDVMGLLPADWTINPETGALTAPVGAKLALRNLKHPVDLLEQIALPKIPDLDTGFGIGGNGSNVQEGMNHSLAAENLADFVLSQDDKGILNVVGMGDSAGKKYSFIPDMDNIIQVDGKEIPIGLSVTEGGFYVITTPEQQQYQVIPAPQYPIALSKILGDGQVNIGKQGDVFLSYESSSVRHQELIHQVIIFDPFIEPIPEEFCEEIALEEFVCDFETALLEMQPGIHLPNDTRTKKSPQTGKVVYENGSSQIIKPTLLSPDIFIKEGLKFEGV